MEISPVEALLGTFCSCMRVCMGKGHRNYQPGHHGDTAAWRFQFPDKADADARAWRAWLVLSPPRDPLFSLLSPLFSPPLAGCLFGDGTGETRPSVAQVPRARLMASWFSSDDGSVRNRCLARVTLVVMGDEYPSPPGMPW